MYWVRLFAVLLFGLLLVTGCDVGDENVYHELTFEPTPPDESPTPPDYDDDTDGGIDDDDDVPIGPLPQWLVDRPQLQNRSRWRQDVDMAKPPRVAKLGCQGVGNGKVFGILGNQFPLASWHNLGGPTYQKNDKWFSDKEPWLIAQGAYQRPDTQSISRVRHAPVVIAAAANERLEWTSVNFAPHYADEPLVEQALVSVWIVRNLTQAPLTGLYLEIDANFGGFDGKGLHETDWSNRNLAVRAIGAPMTSGDKPNDVWIVLDDLGPGEEQVVVVPYIFAQPGDDPDEIYAAIEGADIDAILESTLRWWNAWARQMTRFETPDDKFNDLFDSLALGIKVNQAAGGGLSQMSQYGSVWLRDTHGPSLLLPLVGLTGDLKEFLDYHYGAVLIRGGLSNAVDSDYDVSDPPPPPDWRNLPTMTGRTRAEGPSMLVLEYENYYQATGDLDTLAERYGMLYHALAHQQFVDGCLQYYSSDETFEDVMEAAFGQNILWEPDESLLSLYSSLVMIRAASFMAFLADELGENADAAMFTQMVEDFLACLDATYWINGKGFYAVQADTATREPFARPYEDINTIPLWLDVPGLDANRVRRNFEYVLDKLGQRNGTIHSDVAWFYDLVFSQTSQSVQTGMSHGYWLGNLDKMFHPVADEAFRRWRDWPTAAGFTDEAIVTDDFGHLSILREPWGFAGDISARFRSWESGVMGQAFLYHLTGYDYDLVTGTATLAPHLPPEWDDFALRGLSFGNGRFDLEVSRTADDGRRIVLVTDEAASFALTLTVPMDEPFGGATVNGEAVPATAAENDYGRVVVRFSEFDVPAGAAVEIVIATAD